MLYELWFGRTTSFKYFKVFGKKLYIIREAEDLGSFESRCDAGIFLGYSNQSKSYKCCNKRLHKLVESVHFRVDESQVKSSRNNLEREFDDEDIGATK